MVFRVRSQGFDSISGINYGFYGRQDGVSKGIYESLNCGVGSNDDLALVTANRTIVADNLGIEPGKLISLYQIHSHICLTVSEPWAFDDRPQADAFVTDQPGIGLGILTADCVPVLFYGEKDSGAPIVGAAHAGWKGALEGVLRSTVQAMAELGAVDDSIRAVIGPCIQKKSYEVGQEFYDQFLNIHDDYERFFISGTREGHYMFDLPGFCGFQLAKTGVKKVEILGEDTYSEADKFFSYRRKTHKGEDDYGRQISAICICP